MAMAAIIHQPGAGSVRVCGGVYHTRVAPDRLVVRNAVTGRQYADVPTAALDRRGRVVAIGRAAEDAAGAAGLALRRPFARGADPNEVDCAARLLRAFLRWAQRVSWWPLLIRGLIVQPAAFGDGPTEREREWLVAVARRAGARRVLVWAGPPLSDREAVEAFFPPLDRLAIHGGPHRRHGLAPVPPGQPEPDPNPTRRRA